MANRYYPKGLEQVHKGNIDWEGDDLRAVFVLSSYTYDATDEFLSEVSPAAGGISAQLANATITVDATGIKFTADNAAATPSTLQSINAIVICAYTGTPATSRVLLYIDVGSGLVFVSDGTEQNIVFSSSPDGIMAVRNL